MFLRIPFQHKIETVLQYIEFEYIRHKARTGMSGVCERIGRMQRWICQHTDNTLYYGDW